jgi:hypothetical protein
MRFFDRRQFFGCLSAVSAWALGPAAPAQAAQSGRAAGERARLRKPYIAIQVGAVSFVDEGTDKVLDIFQERARVNTLWLNTYTYGRGTGGRQLPGHPLPDHGVQAYDTDYHGGAFYDYDPKYFRNTCLDDFRAPDYNRIDIIREVVPKAKKRGMDVFAWDYNNAYEDMPRRMKNYQQVLEVDAHGRRSNTPCFNNENYRNHLFGKIEDLLKTYPDLDGIAWGCERQGPLMNMIGGGWTTPYVTCFCADCRSKAKDRGLSADRARRGYLELEQFLRAARADLRPPDGYFVTFWRLLLDYPEILGWEKLWTDSYHGIRSEIYGIAKAISAEKPVGWHIMHNATLSPFYRAEENYAVTRTYSDYVKPVTYNNCAGPRMVTFLDSLSGTIFKDAKPADYLGFYYKLMNYEEAPLDKLPTSGLSADYVYREAKRAIAGVSNEVPVYPGIDIDIPTGPAEKQTTPDDVREAVKAAFRAGAQGVVLSRKYSEMKLANLAGAGAGLREAGIA